MPAPQALKVFGGWGFCGEHPQRLFAYAHSDGGKRLRSKCRRIKSFTRLRNRSFFVETLWSIATFRVSEEKFQISFWQRFFFLWLRFFLFGRSKKKEMNKTALCTKIFRFIQSERNPPQGKQSRKEQPYKINNKKPSKDA